MKVTLSRYEEGVPARGLYRKGVDFHHAEFDAGCAEAAALLASLKGHRSNLGVEAPNTYLCFYIESDGSLWVEVVGDDFWAVSRIDLTAGAEIIRLASAGSPFGERVPTTGREWDAYGLI
ncbi:MAG: hypothetical protein LC800_08875 [Acidobacteria bacterium]|nr:hypothetical protein [Acidobacteriota bacterium]